MIDKTVEGVGNIVIFDRNSMVQLKKVKIIKKFHKNSSFILSYSVHELHFSHNNIFIFIFFNQVSVLFL